MTQCRIEGCPGEYEDRHITIIERHDGEPVLVGNVPAQVCSFCGDRLLSWETVGRLEELRRQPPAPTRLVPLYTLPDTGGGAAAVPAVLATPAGDRDQWEGGATPPAANSPSHSRAQ